MKNSKIVEGAQGRRGQNETKQGEGKVSLYSRDFRFKYRTRSRWRVFVLF